MSYQLPGWLYSAIGVLPLICPLYAIVPQLDNVDSPTAVSLERGQYQLGFTAYDDGGILNKSVLGLSDNIYLGVAFDVANAIGDGKTSMNVPGVIARAKLTDGWENFPILIAIGYDSFYSGRNGRTVERVENPLNRVIYGPYGVITKPIFLFGAEQHFHVGVRTPTQPLYRPEDTSTFFAFDFPMGYFVPIFEIERVYFDRQRLSQTLYNIGLRLNVIDNLALEFDFMMGTQTPTNRMLVIEYIDKF